MKITKKQIRRIIKEEKARLLREQEPAGQRIVPPYESFQDVVDSPILDAALDLAGEWSRLEAESWSSGDPSMNMNGELSDEESKKWWAEQVGVATEELEEELVQRLREVAIQVMQNKTDELIAGDITA